MRGEHYLSFAFKNITQPIEFRILLTPIFTPPPLFIPMDPRILPKPSPRILNGVKHAFIMVNLPIIINKNQYFHYTPRSELIYPDCITLCMIESDDFEKSMHTSKCRKEYIPEVSFVNTMLEKILGSKSKIRILRSILKSPKRSYSMEDIVKDTGMSFGTVHPAMQNLVNSRIIVTQKIGRSIAYKINRTHILFQDIKALFKSETSVFKEKAIEFVKSMEKKGLENIILFGSVAREEVIEAGDIDLLFIYSDTKVEQKIEGHVMDFLEKYDIVISPIFLSIKETKKRIKDLDDFILRTIEEGVILYGDKKWLKK